jgi:hypothetical protein
MPIGRIRLWKGIDLTTESGPDLVERFRRIAQECRNDWLIFRNKHGIAIHSARVSAPTTNFSTPSDDEVDHNVHKLLHKLSQPMALTKKACGNTTTALHAVNQFDLELSSKLFTSRFAGLRANQLQQLRKNIEFLYSRADDESTRARLRQIHEKLDKFLMVEKRYGHCELDPKNSNPQTLHALSLSGNTPEDKPVQGRVTVEVKDRKAGESAASQNDSELSSESSEPPEAGGLLVFQDLTGSDDEGGMPSGPYASTDDTSSSSGDLPNRRLADTPITESEGPTSSSEDSEEETSELDDRSDPIVVPTTIDQGGGATRFPARWTAPRRMYHCPRPRPGSSWKA